MPIGRGLQDSAGMDLVCSMLRGRAEGGAAVPQDTLLVIFRGPDGGAAGNEVAFRTAPKAAQRSRSFEKYTA